MDSQPSSFLQERKLHRLRCSVKYYDWGRRGNNSGVARLFALNSGSEIQPEEPYAEFWMGTHESGPSFVVPTDGEIGLPGVSLKSWISDNRDVLGDKVLDEWGSDLPFLFKVLSVAKALSIQAHPHKELARALHKARPDMYKDDNHKPEMALAVTEFEALCGFIGLEELKGVLLNVPEIEELVSSADVNQILLLNEQDGEEKVKSVLRSTFTQLMLASKEMITEVISKIKSRLHEESQVRQLTDKELLVLQLEKQYPADVGVISAFFFNHVKLNPGEALYLGANEPHAYLSGECIECMATSDNVVRAGLTPKYRDVETLCSMLTYKQVMNLFKDDQVLVGCSICFLGNPYFLWQCDRPPSGIFYGFYFNPHLKSIHQILCYRIVWNQLMAIYGLIELPVDKHINLYVTSGAALTYTLAGISLMLLHYSSTRKRFSMPIG